MKKLIPLLCVAFMFFGALSMSSCKKCSTCSYTYQVAGEPIATYTYPELCGNSTEINNYEDACAAAAAIYGNSCTCISD